VHRAGKKDVHHHSGLGAGERCGNDTDNLEVRGTDADAAAEDAWIALEPARPVALGDHGLRMQPDHAVVAWPE
jgi:hypothetical protein